jgi:menaquinone-dependent protoporphyrinogen oxidase
MSEGPIVVLYGSREGQTAKIAARIAACLREAGHDVELADVRGPAPCLECASAVLIGAALRFGHYHPDVEKFCAKNRALLSAVPNAFFAVSLSAARDNPRAQGEVWSSIDRFVQKTGWAPDQRVPFAGAIAWTRYPLYTKLLMILLLKMLKATELDTSRDYDLTDWNAVDLFAWSFADKLRPADRARRSAVQ